MTAALFASAAILAGAAFFRRSQWFDSVAYIAALVCAVVAVGAALGMPKPSWFGHASGTRVLAMQFDEGHAIWLWTRAGSAAPIAYVLPWDEKRAAKIDRLLREARKQHRPMQWGIMPAGIGRSHIGGAHVGPASGNDAFGGASNAGFHLAPHTQGPDKAPL